MPTCGQWLHNEILCLAPFGGLLGDGPQRRQERCLLPLWYLASTWLRGQGLRSTNRKRWKAPKHIGTAGRDRVK